MTSRVRDGATIAFVVALSAVPYVGRVAFESDDWTFAALVSSAPHASFPSAFAALEAQDRTLRPVQFAGIAILALIGHESPVVDSFATTLAFALVAIGFYLTLRCLGVARTYALAAALVAAVAPNAATNRFWAAVPANLSLAFAFASVCAGLAATRATGFGRAARTALALACELACGLTYEVALPLFVPIAAAYMRRSRALAYATVGLACALVVGKAALETRAGYDPHALLPFVLRHATSFARVEFVELGVALPATAWTAARLLDGATIACALGVAIACALALVVARDDASSDAPPRGTWRLFGWGAIACVLAYALFATDRNTLWTGSGLENRKLAAFALGVALVVVALASAFARAFGRRAARLAFASAIGAYACAGSLVVEVVGASHVAAANVQRHELAAARADVRALPSAATIVIGGCDDVGPGVVFEAPWDATAAVRFAGVGARTDVRADVVGATTRAAPEGIVTRVYGDRRTYAYGSRLFGYDARSRRLVALVNRSAGDAFVGRTRRDDRDAACAGGDAGIGAPIFATDRALAGAGPLDVERLRSALARRYIL